MRPIPISVLKQLHVPSRRSHKGKNGVLYIAAGSKQYHGALLYAILAAEHFVDLIYVETDPSNRAAVRSLKGLHPAIILVTPKQRAKYLAKSDCLLLGPGLGRGNKTKALVQSLLNHPKRPAKTVVDADALGVIQPQQITAGTILTPHPGEMRPEFESDRHAGVILKKGTKAIICQGTNCRYNTSGIARQTKGGLGDLLAGLTAAFACTNPPYRAACAASLLLSRTVIRLQRQRGAFVTTRLIPEQLPLTLKRYLPS
ncbi:MAG: hypothetical protein HY565_06110 [Candidatus Kerfeldbacteria bacterium]|nr:hypothetical protein [Candidatus Kerfeldbacteria bacterium]